MSLPPIDPPSSSSYADAAIGDTSEDPARRKKRSNAATGASAAGVRALSAQAVAFYFRAPAKAFFRTRVDYLTLAKAINPRVAEGGWSWHTTTPGLLIHAVRTHGWRFIPDQVLPPLVANVGVGAILYTSYLQILGYLHEPALQATKRIYPPPPPEATLTAGFAAGAIQSIAAAPLDAIQVRFDTNDVLRPQFRNVWQYGKHKLHEIGIQGIFSGWGLSFLKDAFGSALFFCAFETVKAQAYYSFVTHYYGSLQPQLIERLSSSPRDSVDDVPSIKPHYALEPFFIMLAGITASAAQQLVQHPLTNIQNVYYERLEYLDRQASKSHSSAVAMMRHHYHAYEELFVRCRRQAGVAGGWRTWLFKGLVWNTVRQVPSTSAGLVIFELVRRKYGTVGEAVHIRRDGYDIML